MLRWKVLVAALVLAGCDRLAAPRMDGEYELENDPTVTLSIAQAAGGTYDYLYCDVGWCHSGEMRVISAFNGVRGEAAFYGIDQPELDAASDGDQRPRARSADTDDEVCILTFQNTGGHISFVVEPEADRRFVLAPN